MESTIRPRSRRGRALRVVHALADGYRQGLRLAPPDSPRAGWLRSRLYCLMRDAELLALDGVHVEPLVRQYMVWARR